MASHPDFGIYTDAAGGTAVSTTAATEVYDTTVLQDPAFTMNGSTGEVTCNRAGLVVALWGAQFGLDAEATGERVTRCVLNKNAAGLASSFAFAYFSDTSGIKKGGAFGASLVNVALNDLLKVVYTQEKASGTGTYSTVAARPHLQVMMLPSSFTAAILELTTNTTLTGTFANIPWDSDIRVDTADFTHPASPNNYKITLKTVGRYLVFCNGAVRSTKTSGASNGATIEGKFQLAGADVVNSTVRACIPATADATQAYASMCFAMIVDNGSANQDLVFQARVTDTSSESFRFQQNRAGIGVVLIEDRETLRIEHNATQGCDATLDVAQNVEAEKDGSYTHSTSTNPEETTFAQGRYITFALQNHSRPSGNTTNLAFQSQLQVPGGADLGRGYGYGWNRGIISGRNLEKSFVLSGALLDLSGSTTYEVEHSKTGTGSDTTAIIEAAASIALGEQWWALNVSKWPIFVSPTSVSLAGSTVTPSASIGAVTVSPDSVSLAGAAQGPSASAGAITAEPGSASASATAVAPAASMALTVEPGTPAATATAITPSAALGGVTVEPGTPGAAFTAAAPSIALTLTVTPGTPTLASSSIGPAGITLSAITVLPGVASLISAAISPSISGFKGFYEGTAALARERLKELWADVYMPSSIPGQPQIPSAEHVPVQWDNLPAPRGSGLRAVASVVFGSRNTQLTGFSSSIQNVEAFGMIEVRVYCPVALGTTPSREAADEIARNFRTVQDQWMVYYDPSIENGGRVGSDYLFIVRCPFRAEDSRAKLEPIGPLESGDFHTAADALHSYIEEEIMQKKGIKVAYDAQPDSVISGERVRASIRHGGSFPAGSGVTRHVGVVAMDVKVPIGTGEKRALQIVDIVDDAMRLVNVKGTQLGEPTVQRGRRVGSDWVVPVICPWTRDFMEFVPDPPPPPPIVGGAQMLSSITAWGQTVTFDQAYAVGEYRYPGSGDFFVVAPSGLTIVSKTPGYENKGTFAFKGVGYVWHANGASLEVNPRFSTQSWDSTCYQNGSYNAPNYQHANNFAAALPFVVPVNRTAIFAASKRNPFQRPQIFSMLFITTVASAPPDGSFRPTYARDPDGGAKPAMTYKLSDILWSRVPSLAIPSDPNQLSPDWSALEPKFDGCWFEGVNDSSTILKQFTRPSVHMQAYGQDIQSDLMSAAAKLILNYPQAEKTKVLADIIQIGLDRWQLSVWDRYNTNKALGPSGHLGENAGHGAGYKWTIMLTGLLLGNTTILDEAKSVIPFTASTKQQYQEDNQYFTTYEAPAGTPMHGRCGFGPKPAGATGDWVATGTAWWGIAQNEQRHQALPTIAPSQWDTFAAWADDQAHPRWPALPSGSKCPRGTNNTNNAVRYHQCCTVCVHWMWNLWARVWDQMGLINAEDYFPSAMFHHHKVYLSTNYLWNATAVEPALPAARLDIFNFGEVIPGPTGKVGITKLVWGTHGTDEITYPLPPLV